MMDAKQMHQQQRCTNMTANYSVAEHSKASKMASKAMYLNQQQQAYLWRRIQVTLCCSSLLHVNRWIGAQVDTRRLST